MSSTSGAMLSVQPSELTFESVKFGQVYQQTVTITNQSQAPVEASLRPGSADRYTLTPQQVRLAAGQSVEVEVKLRVLRFARKAKAAEQGQRDIIHVKSAFFDQKFYATFFLARDEGDAGASPQPPQPAAKKRVVPVRARSESPTRAQTAVDLAPAAEALRRPTPSAAATALAQQSTEPGAGGGVREVRGSDPDAARMEEQLSTLRSRLRASRQAEDTLKEDVSRLQSSLREKQHLLELSEARRENALQQERYRTKQLQDLQEENARLQARLREQLLEGVQHPDTLSAIEGALQQERELQESRNARVLELLQTKDQAIQRLEAEAAQRRAELARLADGLAREQEGAAKAQAAADRAMQAERDASAAYKAELDSLKEQVRERSAAALSADGALQELQEARIAVKRLKSELRAERGASASATADCQSLRNELAAARDSIAALEKKLAASLADAAEDMERVRASRQQEVAALEAQLHDLQHALQASRPDAVGLRSPPRLPPAQSAPPSSAAAGGQWGAAPDAVAIEARVRALEAANASLEAALIEAHRKSATSSSASRRMAADAAELQQARAALSERDMEVGRLTSELTMLRSRVPAPLSLGSAGQRPAAAIGGGGGGSENEALAALRQKLEEREALLASSQSRIARLEALHKLAQDSALACEAELSGTQAELSKADVELRRVTAELQQSRAVCATLNARLTDLAGEEKATRLELEHLRQKLQQQRDAHQQELVAIEATQPQALASQHGLRGNAPAHDSPPTSPTRRESADPTAKRQSRPYIPGEYPSWESEREDLLNRQRALQRAVDDAEVAMSGLQAKLIAAEQRRLQAQQAQRTAQEAADIMRGDLEQAVRAATEEGSMRIASLEESVKKLSGRGELHMEVARLSGDNSRLRRSEARLKSDLEFAHDRVQALLQTLERERAQALKQHGRQVALDVLGAGAQPSGTEAAATGDGAALSEVVLAQANAFERDREQQQGLVARLVERAEKAEVQLGQAASELAALKQQRARVGDELAAGAGAVVNATRAVEGRVGDLEQAQLVKDAHIRTLQEALQLREAELARAQVQLGESHREVAAAQARIASAERRAHDASDLASRRAVEGRANASRELAAARRATSQAQTDLRAAQQAKQDAEAKLRCAEVEVARVRAESEQQALALKRRQSDLTAELAAARDAGAAAARDVQRLTGDVQQRKMQVAVLMETVETLQAGSPGAQEQRVITLTAQLMTGRAAEGALERRVAALTASNKALVDAAAEARASLDAVTRERAEAVAEAAVARAAADAASQEVAVLKDELRHAELEGTRLLQELDACVERQTRAEAECAGLQAALAKARTRHFEQLNKERSATGAAARAAQSDVLTRALTHAQSGADAPEPAYLSRMRARLGQLLQQGDGEGGRGKAEGEASWHQEVIRQLQGMILDAERERSRAVVDARIAQDEVAATRVRVRAAEAAAEASQASWEAAETELVVLRDASTRLREQQAAHFAERSQLQERRIAALSGQVARTAGQVVELGLALKTASEASESAQARLHAVSTSLARCEAERDALAARVDGLQLELTGSPEGGWGDRSSAVESRDAAIRDYFQSNVYQVLVRADDTDKTLALTREICALKLVESQLLASMAAANGNSDASEAKAQQLAAALAASEKRLAELQSDAPKQRPAHSEVAVAELNAALAAKSHELYVLQDAVVQAKHQAEMKSAAAAQLATEKGLLEDKLARAREDGAAQLNALREDLTADSVRERELLLAEVENANARVAELQAQLSEQQTEEWRRKAEEAKGAEALTLRDAVARIESSSIPAAALQDAHVSLALAEQQVERLQQENDGLAAQAEAVSDELSRCEAELAAMHDLKETNQSAIAGLEATLMKIENQVGRNRSVLHTHSASARYGRASSLNSAAAEDVQLAALARQLVSCKLAEADAQRRLRVSARNELELRQRLHSRDERIQQLKEMVLGLRAEVSVRRKQQMNDALAGKDFAAAPQQEGGAPSRQASPSRFGSARASMARRQRNLETSVSARVTSGFEFEEMDDNSMGAERREVSRVSSSTRADARYSGPRDPTADPVLAGDGLADDSVHVAEAAALRVELAKRDAEIEYLQGALAEAVASSQQLVAIPELLESAEEAQSASRAVNEDLSHLRSHVARCINTLKQAVLHYKRGLARDHVDDPVPAPPETVDSDGLALVALAEQVAAHTAEREQAVWRLQVQVRELQGSLSAHESRAQESRALALQASQRVVIGDLTTKNAALARSASALQQENGRLTARLRVLLSSIGDDGEAAVAAPPVVAPGGRVSRAIRPSSAPVPRGRPPKSEAARERASSPSPTRPRSSGVGLAATGQNAVGLAGLMQQHVSILMDHQRSFAAALSTELDAGSESPPGDNNTRVTHTITVSGVKTILELTQSAAVELNALDATLDVLLSDLEAEDALADGEKSGRGAAADQAARTPLARRQRDAGGPRPSTPEGRASTPPAADASARQSEPRPSSRAVDADAEPGDPSASRLQAELDRSRSRIRVLESECRKHQDALKSNALELEALRKEVDDAAGNALKWKKKHGELRLEMQKVTSMASQNECDLQGRISEQSAAVAHVQSRHGADVQRLQAAVAGLEAANAALEDAKRSAAESSLAQGARAAKAEAQVAVLEQQLVDSRDREDAQQAALKAEVESLKNAVQREKAERARIIDSLRATIQGVRAAGSEESRLQEDLLRSRAELLDAHKRADAAEVRAAAAAADADAARSRLRLVEAEVASAVAAAASAEGSAALELLQVQRLCSELQTRLNEAEARQDALERGFQRKLDGLAQVISAAEQHLQAPSACLNELSLIQNHCEVLEGQIALIEQGQREEAAAQQRLLQSDAEDTAQQLHQLQSDLSELQLAADSEQRQLSAAVAAAQRATAAAQDRASDLQAQLDDARAALAHAQESASEELRGLASRHASQIAEMQAAQDIARDALQAQLADALADAGIQSARVRDAEAAVEAAQEERREALVAADEARRQARGTVEATHAQLAELQAEFDDYQQAKAFEIAALEGRVRDLICSGSLVSPSGKGGRAGGRAAAEPPKKRAVKRKAFGRAGGASDAAAALAPKTVRGGNCESVADASRAAVASPVFMPSALRAAMDGVAAQPASRAHQPLAAAAAAHSHITAAIASDAVLSAQRETDFERLARQRAQAELAAANDANRVLRAKLKAAQDDLRDAQHSSAAAAAALARQEAALDAVAALRSEMAELQDQLRAARAESARRGAQVKALQDKAESGEPKAEELLKAECAAHVETREKLAAARNALERKGTLAAELRRRLEGASQTAADLAAAQTALAAAERQVRELQAALARKEATVSELKLSADRATAAAVETALAEVRQSSEGALRRARGDVQRKDALLAACRSELESERLALAEARAKAQASASKEASTARAVEGDVAAAREMALELLRGGRAMARLVLRCAAAMRAGATVVRRCQEALAVPGRPMHAAGGELAADQVAGMVGLSVAEVSDLLSATPRVGLAGGPATATHIAQLLRRLQSALERGGAALPRSRSAAEGDAAVDGHLASLLAVLQAEVHKAEASLALSIAALPALASAAASNPDRSADGGSASRAKRAIEALPGVREAADQLEQSLAWAIDHAGHV